MTLPSSLWILGKPYRVYVGRKDMERVDSREEAYGAAGDG